jgi:hypothetical protein
MARLDQRIAALEVHARDRRPVTALTSGEIMERLLRIRLGRKPTAEETGDEIARRQSMTTDEIRARLAEIRATRRARRQTT